MVQQVIVACIGVVVVLYIVWRIVRAIRRKSVSCGCGCGDCTLSERCGKVPRETKNSEKANKNGK
ncbi:MAG: DUF1206 domain-containing protein [Coprobacter sp.]|nr:DUF1206 domain-containing protein [Coprobacter sp.]